jgi:hypothetical protein
MAINFSQFPLAATPLQSTDFVVGYQVRGSTPTLAQYTVAQFLGSALTFSNEGAGVGIYDSSNSTAGNYLFKTLVGNTNVVITDNGASGVSFSLSGVGLLSGANTWTGANDFTGGSITIPTVATATNSTAAASTAWTRLLLASPSAIGNTAPNTGAFTTLSATGAITPSQTAGIVGTTTNNNANTGAVGEYVSNSTTGVSLSTGISANITSISLTAGDWDVSAAFVFNPANTTVFNLLAAGVSTTSANFGGLGTRQKVQYSTSITATAGYSEEISSPTVRVSISSTTTVFAVASAFFSTSTMTCDSLIRARRVR